MDEVRLERLTSETVSQGDYDKAILPLGATEFHGPHLPYGTDTIAAGVLGCAFARALGRTLVLPPLQFGVSHHHLAFVWTISLRPETLSRIIQDVGASVLSHGIRKLLLVSAHDGNAPVANAAARQLSQDHGLSVAVFAGWQRKAREALAGRHVIDLDHAGRSETSLVLYAAPDVVRLDLASSQPNEHAEYPVDLVGSYADLVPRGYAGDAAAASRAEGEAIVESLVALVVPHLRRLDAHAWKGGAWLSGIR